MKIITLGTSHGNHAPDRFASSTLIEIGTRAYLIDAGEPVSALMLRKGVPFRNLQAVFITHMHDDHTSGLTALVKSVRKYPVAGQHCEIFFPEANAIPAFLSWTSACHIDDPNNILTYREVSGGTFYDDGFINVTSLPTKHMTDGSPSYAYLVEAEGKRVLFSGDLTSDFSDFPQVHGFIDACVCEATHYEPEDALPTFKKTHIGKLIFNHLHENYIGNGEDVFLEKYAALPYPCIVSHDGDEFVF